MSKVCLRDYYALVHSGKRKRNKNFLIFYKKIEQPNTIIKTAVKKIARAHKRNYYKRLLRNVLHSFEYNSSYLILVICLKPIKIPYQRLYQEVHTLVKFLLV